MIVLLPQFRAPKSPISHGGLCIRACRDEDLNGQSPKQMILGMELFGSGRNGTSTWTIADIPNSEVPPNAIAALGDLMTGRWRAVLKRAQAPFGTAQTQELPLFRLTADRARLFTRGLRTLTKHKKLRIAAERWHTGVRRSETLDSVLDMCSSLEACFSLGDELRLRLAFAAYFSTKTRRRRAFSVTYSMYGIRNSFIHGSKIPDVSGVQGTQFVEVVAHILLNAFRTGKLSTAESITNGLLRAHGERPRTPIHLNRHS